MTWKVSADPIDFDEAIAWFRKRVAMTRAERDRLDAESKRKAFFVSHVAQVDIVRHAWESIDKALAKGTPLADFKKEIGPALRAAWAGAVETPAWRLETIFRTNVQSAYAAGRFRQAQHPDIAEDRPVWMFDAILDSRTTPTCKACDGTKRPADDEWWLTHLPPLHFNCRSHFIALSEKQAGKITLHPPTAKPDDGFGHVPHASDWEPDPSKYPASIAAPLAAKVATPPPPPVYKLVDGLHAKKTTIGRGVSAPLAEGLLASIDDAETLKFLEAHPLSQLSFPKQAKVKSKAVNGWYLASKHELELTSARTAGSFGQSFFAGTSWSISTTAATAEKAAAVTLRHELGHHIHLFDGHGTPVDKAIREAYKRARASGVFITRYAGDSANEYFAESYAAYYHRRASLKAHDPNGFAMVEDVLRLRGILP